LEAHKKQRRKKWTDGRQLRNKAERSGQMEGGKETKQKEVDRWEAAKKKSRKKWTNGSQLRNTKQKEVDKWEAAKKQNRKKWTYCGS
jgi:hypothetical protein